MSSRRSRAVAASPDHVEAIEEVFAEAALVDHLREIAVRGGDDTCVDGGWPASSRRAGPRRSGVCAGGLALQARRHFADLVEQERPPMSFPRTAPSCSLPRP